MAKKELYFEDGAKVMSSEDWVKKGKPKEWFKMYDKDNIKVFEDRAYGTIKLVTPQGESQGRDIAVVKDVAVFGPYYEGEVKINVPYRII